MVQAASRIQDARAFRFPNEWGAWWTFELCLASGLFKVFDNGQYWRQALCLAAGMHAFFLAGDWISALCRRRPRASWAAWQGCLLCLCGSALLGLGVARCPADLKPNLAATLELWTGFALAVLWMRLRLPFRDPRLIMTSAVLLTGPSLILGQLAFDGLNQKTFAYWGLWAWFFPWGVFYIQTWLLGTSVPRWRIAAASLPFILEAAMLAYFSCGWGSLLLALLSGRIAWRLHRRLAEFDRPQSPPPWVSSSRELHLLGLEEIAWSLVLGGIWVLG